jgi:hypothetical protein
MTMKCCCARELDLGAKVEFGSFQEALTVRAHDAVSSTREFLRRHKRFAAWRK